jgi:hypothetical protein
VDGRRRPGVRKGRHHVADGDVVSPPATLPVGCKTLGHSSAGSRQARQREGGKKAVPVA